MNIAISLESIVLFDSDIYHKASHEQIKEWWCMITFVVTKYYLERKRKKNGTSRQKPRVA
jgi:hypothetical protein